jgi:periplasmic protein CpxP/Spy
MRSRQLALLLFLLTLTVSATVAQDAAHSTPEERALKMTDWMKNELRLTADQEPLVHTINLKYATENEALRNSGKRKLAKYRALKSRQDAKEVELKRVLTPEQFNSYIDKRDELQKRMKEEWKESRD